jgi:phenylacetyl-CoA:acceptor oxidoreductase subunit 2
VTTAHHWLQKNWDARAALNFMFGGAGAGLLIFSSLSKDMPAVFVGLALVAAGLSAVWLEIGRKLRAIHVFFNPFTSWMTRESFAALALFPVALVYPPLAALLAAAFLYCQARILRAAKGIPAWRAPETVPLIVSTGLAEGAGIALWFSAGNVLVGLFALAVLARLVAWHRHPLAPNKALAWSSTAVALALVFLMPPLGGLAALAAGWWLKFALVTRASFNQGFSLPQLPVRGSR